MVRDREVENHLHCIKWHKKEQVNSQHSDGKLFIYDVLNVLLKSCSWNARQSFLEQSVIFLTNLRFSQTKVITHHVWCQNCQSLFRAVCTQHRSVPANSHSSSINVLVFLLRFAIFRVIFEELLRHGGFYFKYPLKELSNANIR